MQWFRRYWEVLVPISLTLVLALFELVEHFTGPRTEVPPQVFLWLILVYPLVYYVVFPHPRYRHPIEPEMGMLIVFGIVGSYQKMPERGD